MFIALGDGYGDVYKNIDIFIALAPVVAVGLTEDSWLQGLASMRSTGVNLAESMGVY